MSCTRCGMCCFPFAIALARDEETARFWVYHGLKVDALDDERMVIRMSSKCEMLQFNPDGTTGCGCYSVRPEICKQYLCDRAKQE